jgi:urease accessory protein
MAEPTIIRGSWPHPTPTGSRIDVEADRATLLKRRWRGTARNGMEFGFDLEAPLADGTVFFADEAAHYVVTQKSEPVLRIPLRDFTQAARVAWSLGNLHFPVQVGAGLIVVADDSAIRLYLERDHVVFSEASEVFHPIKAAGSHYVHHDGHGH